MKRAELQRFKDLLLKRKAEILDGARESMGVGLGQENNALDFGDLASQETDRNLLLRIRDRERKLLAKVEEALKRIDMGTFGICEDCGGEIGVKRLQARPVATLCIECKTLQEKREHEQGE
jgi:RNA polymerase-binding transcription factor